MYVRRFSEIGKADVAVAGGKGANLGELTNAGVAVPNGFVLTTDAYRAFVEANDLTGAITDALTTVRAGDPASTAAAEARIVPLFEAGRMPDQVAAELLDAWVALGEEGCGGGVAVRSSATTEDRAEASFAGQQETILNVRGRHQLLRATQRCWGSLWTARAIAYRAQAGLDPADAALAVVVQCMVAADASGVMFTVDPTAPGRTQAVISSAWGLGEAVVSGAVTTDDVVVERATGRILHRTTADKQVMTVATADGTENWPVPDAQRRTPVLSDAQAVELAELGRRIETHFGAPQDIEWTLQGGRWSVVQSRPITTLAPEVDWDVPQKGWMYVRGSIIEQMPDPLSPLFGDLAERYVVPALGGLLARWLPGVELRTDDIGFPRLHGYAYYGYSPMFLVRYSAVTPKLLPLVFRRGEGSGQNYWQSEAHPAYRARVAEWREKVPAELPATTLLNGIEELTAAGFAYYSSVQTIIPAAASAEMVFRWVYERFVRRPGDPKPETFLLGFESAPIKADQSLFGLARWARRQPGLADALGRLVDLDGDAPEGVTPVTWAGFRQRLGEHLERFGHTLYNMDIKNPVAADTPSLLLETLRFYMRGGGVDPHDRQWRLAAARDAAQKRVAGRLTPQRRKWFLKLLGAAQPPVAADTPSLLLETLRFYMRGGGVDPHDRQWRLAAARDAAQKRVAGRLTPQRRKWFLKLLGAAQRLAPVREDALADVGLAWPTIRRLAAELGRRLTERGVLDGADDVYWLTLDEVARLAAGLDGGADASKLGDRRTVVRDRQAEWRQQRLLHPPGILPERSWGQSFARWMPEVMDQGHGPELKGTGASGGRVTAPARVLHGPEDFADLRPGEVLVAPITTPAWTPLFAMASAVVTDVGGPLSHSSIVAREYGIPAVLGTSVATDRIRSGQTVTVDGTAGLVHLGGASIEEPDPTPARAGAFGLAGLRLDEGDPPPRWPLYLGGGLAVSLALSAFRRWRASRH